MKQMLSISRYFSALLLTTLLTVAFLGWLIWQTGFSNQLQELRESRFQFSLDTVRTALESGLRLGLSPADLPGAQTLIDQARAREPGILSIDVFDPRGRILFTTDQDGVGVSVPVAWRNACLDIKAGAIWNSVEDNDNLQCAVLVNGYEQASGGVLLRYRSVPARLDMSGAGSEPWLALLGTLALLLGIGSVLGWLMVRPMEQRFEAQTRALEGVGQAQDDPLIGPVANATQRMSQIRGELSDIEAEVDRIDQMEAR